MFVGMYPVRLDAKNRVIVPQRLRESQIEGGPLWSKFYLTLGTESCIAVYTPEGWQQLMQEMGAAKSVVDESVRILQRMTAANVDMRECDMQGRVVLSDGLRRHAGITRDLIWIGAVSRAEIWNPERWTAFNRKHISELGEKMDIVSRAGLALPERNDNLRRGPQG
jgi:MraZ protein